MTEIELTGDPTTWEDTLEDGTVVTGEARRIHFDIEQNVVTLTGSARLEHEQGRYTGDELVYDLDTESLAGRGTDGNRVRVVIEPEAVDQGQQSLEADDNGEGNGSDEPAGDDSAAREDAEASTDDEPPAAH
jgi:lipopolysaccharide export system protein LptA